MYHFTSVVRNKPATLLFYVLALYKLAYGIANDPEIAYNALYNDQLLEVENMELKMWVCSLEEVVF